MARKRKNEMKTSVKSSLKYIPVRKSSRQIAKKQLEEKRVNGEILQTSTSNNIKESRLADDAQNQMPSRRNQSPQKKHHQDRSFSDSETTLSIDNTMCNVELQYKRDAGESDSQDGLDNVMDQSDKLSPEDVRQMVVGNPNPTTEATDPASTEVEVWPEDVIEETIICEEMEVEGDVPDSGYTIGQGNVMVERVLLMDEPNLAGKEFMEFTVIRNSDGTESMVMNSDNVSSSRYQIIEENVDTVQLTEPESSVSALYGDEESLSSNNENYSEKLKNFSKSYVNKKKNAAEGRNCKYMKDDSAITERVDTEQHKESTSVKVQRDLPKEESSSSSDFLEETSACRSENIIESKELQDVKVVQFKNEENSFCKIDDKMAGMQISESSKEIQKLVNDLSNLESIDSPVRSASVIEKISSIDEDDESNSSILDKMEQLHQQTTTASTADANMFRNSVEQNDALKNELSRNSSNYNEKPESPNQLLSKSRAMSSKKTLGPRNIEGDSKMDGEDMKSSSSSENSSDTLLSINNCKIRDNDIKGAGDGEKKLEFRSRSGSTDTTGSESGSNSSGVRRSSRIRSIGLMKQQRSRGRGLVTKSSVDISKSGLHQDREKITNSTANVQEPKSNLDNNPETLCDKDSGQSKINTYDTLAPLASSCNTTGYDSDSSKPVKVKSRWRRSSELEMGGSSSGFGSITGPTIGSGIPTNVASEPGARFSFKSGPTVIESESSESASGQTLSSTNSQAIVSAESSVSDSSTTTSNSSAKSSVPQVVNTVGAKIPLPMVLETRDREMEERLSQFEHLRENLYLTERYTNKETKRMVCDCFLTEEEIDRGELGCGEDCLNRLLMIECGTRCVVGDRCTNKRFQNCEYAKCEVFRTEKKGFGLRAVVDLVAGEFIMEYVGEVVDPKDFRRRAKEYSKDKNKHYYFMALKSDQIIDATMKGNVSRFINHSCDPNSETQKWTVNGELRIGFFNKKFIAAGEEITFDYHFQRYGKEAQKCFCEAPNCRGWIGDTPEEEKEKIEKKEKREKDARKKKEEKKPTDYMEDEDLEEEIDKLCSGGLKNRAHTLTLSRLMVRSRELEHRTRLLRLIQIGEQPCRRLFLDYHGLRLIWSYVMDVAIDDSEEAQQFRLEVLKTLNTLPIPNKTMLMDSKIYGVVENWSKRLYLSPNADSPDDDQVKVKTGVDEQSYENSDKKSPERQNEFAEKSEHSTDRLMMNEIKAETDDHSLIPDLAATVLAEWSNLKEVFRIPKKERIEQMKEHEREADRGYREELEKEEKRGTSYDRHRSDRYGRTETDSKRSDRRRGRESPESDHSRMKDKRTEERSTLVPIPRMTKYERRQLFALKVAKEEEERQRRQQQESWQDHEARCMALGIDPHATAMMDPQTGYPVFYNPSLGQWQHYPTQDRGEIPQQCTPVYVGGPQSLPGHSQSGMVSQSSHVLPSLSSDISPGIAQSIPNAAASSVYSLNQTSVFNQTSTSYSILPHRHQQYPDSQVPLASNLVPVHGGTPPMPIPAQQLYLEKPTDRQFSNSTSNDTAQCRAPQTEVPPIDLPPKWKSATDARGRTYYYHTRERISQWLPPPPDHIGVQPDSSSTSESSDESSSSNEEDEEAEDEHTEDQNKTEDVVTNPIVPDNSSAGLRHSATKKMSVHGVNAGQTSFPEPKKRRDGLVQERIISPRREEDRMDHKTYKEIKEKLRRQKERAKLKEHVEKLRKHRRSNKSKSHSRHNVSKLQSSSDVSAMSERKIKDTFRINMANVMVHFLNPYRKNDCKQGRITNTEDFKHLARKLTHFVLAKELKHCKSVDELQCNENVKHKAKDFVRKYMSKFGAVYQKGTDED